MEWDFHQPLATTRGAKITDPRTGATGVVSHILKDLELAGIISDNHYGGFSTEDLAISIQQTVKALFTEIRYRQSLTLNHTPTNPYSGLIMACS